MKFIQKVIDSGYIHKLEDGFTYFNGLSSDRLRQIADYLDEQDKGLRESLDAYFSKEGWDNENGNVFSANKRH